VIRRSLEMDKAVSGPEAITQPVPGHLTIGEAPMHVVDRYERIEVILFREDEASEWCKSLAKGTNYKMKHS